MGLVRLIRAELVDCAAEMEATVRVMDAGRAIFGEQVMYIGGAVRVRRMHTRQVGAFAASPATGDHLRAACLPGRFETAAAAADLLRDSTPTDRRTRAASPRDDLLDGRGFEGCPLERCSASNHAMRLHVLSRYCLVHQFDTAGSDHNFASTFSSAGRRAD